MSAFKVGTVFFFFFRGVSHHVSLHQRRLEKCFALVKMSFEKERIKYLTERLVECEMHIKIFMTVIIFNDYSANPRHNLFKLLLPQNPSRDTSL